MRRDDALAECPFCSLAPERMTAQDSLTFTASDTLPVSPGHTLILPKRHIARIFDATKEEIGALWEAVTIIAVSVFAFFNNDCDDCPGKIRVKIRYGEEG